MHSNGLFFLFIGWCVFTIPSKLKRSANPLHNEPIAFSHLHIIQCVFAPNIIQDTLQLKLWCTRRSRRNLHQRFVDARFWKRATTRRAQREVRGGRDTGCNGFPRAPTDSSCMHFPNTHTLFYGSTIMVSAVNPNARGAFCCMERAQSGINVPYLLWCVSESK